MTRKPLTPAEQFKRDVYAIHKTIAKQRSQLERIEIASIIPETFETVYQAIADQKIVVPPDPLADSITEAIKAGARLAPRRVTQLLKTPSLTLPDDPALSEIVRLDGQGNGRSLYWLTTEDLNDRLRLKKQNKDNVVRAYNAEAAMTTQRISEMHAGGYETWHAGLWDGAFSDWTGADPDDPGGDES